MTNDPKAGGGLDPEMLAAYIDKRLPPDERAAVEAQLASDPDSYELLVELIHANEALKDEQPQEDDKQAAERAEPQSRTGAVVPLVPKPARTRTWAIAGGVLAVAAALVLVVRLQPELWQRLRGGEAVDPQLAKLVAAVGEERYIEARLTGGFKYGPLRSVTRGPGDLSQQNLALLAAAGELQKKAQENPSAENLHAWGVAQLLLGEPNGAIVRLEEAAALPGASDRVLSDLAAGLLSRAAITGRATDVPLALGAADRALLIAPHNEIALFNRAMALQALGLVDQARRAWDAFLQQDDSSDWAAEARRHRARLDVSERSDSWDAYKQEVLLAGVLTEERARIIAAAYPQYSRELIEEELLPSWASATAADEAGSLRLLQKSRVMAAALAAAGGDTLPLLAVDHAAKVEEKNRAGLKAGLTGYGAGRALFEAERVADAAKPLNEAMVLLRTAGSPLAIAAEYAEAQTDYFKGDIAALQQTAVRVLAELEQIPGTRGHQGKINWGLGLAIAVRGDFVNALAYYDAALRAFQQSHERENEANVHSLLAESYAYLADPEQAWRERLAALSMVSSMRTPRRRQAILIGASVLAERQGLPSVAAALLDEAHEYLGAGARPGSRAEVLARIARLSAKAGNTVSSAHSLADARKALGEVDQAGLVDRLQGEILDAELELALAEGRDSASADQVLAVFESRQITARTPRLWLSAGAVRLSAGDTAGAIAAYRSGIDAIRSAPRATQAAWRTNLSEEAVQLSDGLAALLASTGQHAEAVQVLLDSRTGPTLSTTAGSWSAPDEDLLVIGGDKGHLLTWLVSSSGVEHRSSELNSLARRKLSDACRQHVIQPESTAQPCEELFDHLIKPFAFPSGRRLAISPSPDLADFPFSALRNRANGQYLAQSSEVSVLATTSRLSDARKAAHRTPKSALVVGDPEVRALSAPPLPPLPSARVEASRIASVYPSAKSLIGAAATKSAMLAGMATVDVLHFAGHSVQNPSFPGLSRLVLAGAGDDSDLYAFDLAPPAKPQIPSLVVLAACHSASDALRQTLGSLGLPAAFLQAGAQQVIASVTDVPDELLVDTFVRLHGLVAAGEPVARALAVVQRESLQAGAGPRQALSLQLYR